MTLAETRRLSMSLKPSRKWQKLARTQIPGPPGAEVWTNYIYEVNVWRHQEGWVLGGGPWTCLGISSKDGEARHDWRDFQRIKNDVVGPEWEAVELYPSEARLLDPSNYYYLWCAPSVPVGKFCPRVVMGPAQSIAPQRGWHEREGMPR